MVSHVFIFISIASFLVAPSAAYYYPSYTAYFQQDPRAAAYAQQQGFNIGYPGYQQQLMQQQLQQQLLMAQRYGMGGHGAYGGGYGNYGGYGMDPYMQQQYMQQQYMMNPQMMQGYGRPYSPFQMAAKKS